MLSSPANSPHNFFLSFPFQDQLKIDPYISSQSSLLKKYYSQSKHYNLDMMNHILSYNYEESKEQPVLPAHIRIDLADIKYNQESQYMVTYYQANESIIQLTNLLQYYKYYLQETPMMHKEFFHTMYTYSEKKKENIYKKLQKILNLSEVDQTEKQSKQEQENTHMDGAKTELTNILKGLQSSRQSISSKDQSRCIINLKQSLVKLYGESKQLTMKEVDKLYNFPKRNQFSWYGAKKANLINPFKKLNKVSQSSNTKKKVMLESTNFSNSNVHSYAMTPTNNSQTRLHRELHKKSDSKISVKKQTDCSEIYFRKNTIIPFKTSCQNSRRLLYEYQQQKTAKKKPIRRRSCDFLPKKKWKTVGSEKTEQKNFTIMNTKYELGIQKRQGGKIFSFNSKEKNKNLRKSQQNIRQTQKNEGLFIDYEPQKLFYHRQIRKSMDFDGQKSPKLLKKKYKVATQASSQVNIKKTIQNFKNKIKQQMKQMEFKEVYESFHITPQRLTSPSKQISPHKQFFKKKKPIMSSHANLKIKKNFYQQK